MEHIRLSNIYFAYEKDGAEVLHDINLSIEKNETLCIAGANGSGKSTLLMLLAGALTTKRGEITINSNGERKNKMGDSTKSAVVFQEPDYQLFMPLVWEDAAFGILKKGMPPEEAKEAALLALDMVEAAHIAEKPPYKLSGGEKQRAALAGALITRPEVLILDEPSAALDPRARKNLILLLKKLEGTKIIASHDLDLILDLADRVIFLYNGIIAAESSTPGLLHNEVFLQSIGLELPLSCSNKN